MSGISNIPGLLASLLQPEEAKKLAIWAKGYIIPDWPADEWRLDANFKTIRYSHYGDRSSPYGWEMDHHPIPKSMGGSDDVSNLRPLRCAENASAGGILGSFAALGKR